METESIVMYICTTNTQTYWQKDEITCIEKIHIDTLTRPIHVIHTNNCECVHTNIQYKQTTYPSIHTYLQTNKQTCKQTHKNNAITQL